MAAGLTLWRERRPARGRCRRGFDITVRSMRAAGRLEPVDEALVHYARVMADNVDAAERAGTTPYTVAAAGTAYQRALQALYARVGLMLPVDDDEVWRGLSGPLEHATP